MGSPDECQCRDRYPHLFGSDDRMHACMAELGIPLTKEPGFHQVRVTPLFSAPTVNLQQQWPFLLSYGLKKPLFLHTIF